MAQWIARQTSNPEAVGSSPTRDVYAFEAKVVWVSNYHPNTCLLHRKVLCHTTHETNKVVWTILISNIYILSLHVCGCSLVYELTELQSNLI